MADLMHYATGNFIRIATASELEASIEASNGDGGAGVITVEIDGEEIPCYVQE